MGQENHNSQDQDGRRKKGVDRAMPGATTFEVVVREDGRIERRDMTQSSPEREPLPSTWRVRMTQSHPSEEEVQAPTPQPTETGP